MLDLANSLVVGVASSALFDLTESDAVFREQGEQAYREYQAAHLDTPLAPGVAFAFLRRLLALNDLSAAAPLVEVIVLSRNDPETGLRVMESIKHHALPITRAVFTQGRSPYPFMAAFDMSLFLSGNPDDVREATRLGFPAGQVVGPNSQDPGGTELLVAFDFDGVLADDASERINQAEGLQAFQAHEETHAEVVMGRGRLADFLAGLNRIQAIEEERVAADASYQRRLRVAVVTARSAPAHTRVVRTIQGWGLHVNDAFFLGGVEKARVLEVLQPHIFFDDQLRHLEFSPTPGVHVPFGVMNEG